MTTNRKDGSQAPRGDNAPRPQFGTVDIAAMHARISKRFPKVLAELAK